MTCFLPELETRTGLEYLTKLCGWLKLVGPVEDICNFCDLNIKPSPINPFPVTTSIKQEHQSNHTCYRYVC